MFPPKSVLHGERESWGWVGPPAWGRACINSPEWSEGSSRRKRIVARENEASLDWIIVVVVVVDLKLVREADLNE